MIKENTELKTAIEFFNQNNLIVFPCKDKKPKIKWRDIEEQDLQPFTCPFCGYEVDNEEDDVEWVNKDEDDSWN